MPSNRIGYGYGPYGDADWGTEGITQGSSASIVAVATVTAQGGRPRSSSAAIAALSDFTASANATLGGSPDAIASVSTFANVSADKIIDGSASITSDSGNLYGYGGYGQGDFGQTTVEALRIRTSAAPIDVTLTVTTSAQRIQQPSADINATASLAADSDTIVNGQGVFAAQGTVETSALRIRETSGQITVTGSTVIIAREKWEPILKVSEIWTEIA